MPVERALEARDRVLPGGFPDLSAVCDKDFSYATLLPTTPTGTPLLWYEMETSTPLVQLPLGENPWTSERDPYLEEEDEDRPPRRWFRYFPVCGTLAFGTRDVSPSIPGLVSLTILPQ